MSRMLLVADRAGGREGRAATFAAPGLRRDSVEVGVFFGRFGPQDAAMDTWGVSGPVLANCAGILALTTILAVRNRLGPRRPTVTAEELDDYDVAVLNGEPALAVAVALLALDRAGVVELGDRTVRQLATTQPIELDQLTEVGLIAQGMTMQVKVRTELPGDAHPVEVAVYGVVLASSSGRVRDIHRSAATLPALKAVRARLIGLGLVNGQADARRRRQWRWFAPLLLVGVARLDSAISAGTPITGLVALLGVTICVIVVVMVAPAEKGRTPAGDVLLRNMRRSWRGERATNGHCGPSRPSERQLALLGSRKLWNDDRPLALALGATLLGAYWKDRPRRESVNAVLAVGAVMAAVITFEVLAAHGWGASRAGQEQGPEWVGTAPMLSSRSG